MDVKLVYDFIQLIICQMSFYLFIQHLYKFIFIYVCNKIMFLYSPRVHTTTAKHGRSRLINTFTASLCFLLQTCLSNPEFV